ncbi:hypothetical protein Tco_0092934 [Tanacetum coccineum]
MTVRAQPAMSPGHLARLAEAMALSNSAFCKRYRSSYETPSLSSSLTLLVRKRYRGTSELIIDTDSEEDELGEEDTKEDREDESDGDHGLDDESQGLDDEGHGLGDEDHGLDDESQGLDDEGHGLNDRDHGLDDESQGLDDEGHGLGDEGHGLDDESQGLEDEGLGLEEEEVVPEGQQQAVPVTPPSLEWSLGSLLVSPSSPIVLSPIASLVATPTATISVDKDQFIKIRAQLELHKSILHDHTQRLDALPPTLVADIDRDVRELYTRSGAVRDDIFLERYRFRSLEREQERATVTFSAIWKPMLALEACAGQNVACYI